MGSFRKQSVSTHLTFESYSASDSQQISKSLVLSRSLEFATTHPNFEMRFFGGNIRAGFQLANTSNYESSVIFSHNGDQLLKRPKLKLAHFSLP